MLSIPDMLPISLSQFQLCCYDDCTYTESDTVQYAGSQLHLYYSSWIASFIWYMMSKVCLHFIFLIHNWINVHSCFSRALQYSCLVFWQVARVLLGWSGLLLGWLLGNCYVISMLFWMVSRALLESFKWLLWCCWLLSLGHCNVVSRVFWEIVFWVVARTLLCSC